MYRMSTDEYEGMPPLEDIVYTSNLNEMLLTKITELEANKQTEQNAGYLIIANCIKYSLDIILRRGYDKYKFDSTIYKFNSTIIKY